MKNQNEIVGRPGDNHTGITLHPELVTEMIQGTSEFGPTTSGGAEQIAQNRVRVAQKSDPVATMPPSPNLPTERLPLIDKLGARLQFERTGVRLYEALIAKHDAFGSFPGGPSRADLEHIRDEEARHMALAQDLIIRMGGDPTVVTPCANLQSIASRGVGDVLVDPRTTLIECLDAIIVAELTDHENWEMLVAAVALSGEAAGFDGLEAKIREAERTEAEHLVKVRGWLAAAAKLAARAVD
ncbi:MAG TPA: ferritin-like domain-containing protein [Kofleriaceae bacterium]|nr:ferritin-like domain-containing protein [Kofleriaceae bacterium]